MEGAILLVSQVLAIFSKYGYLFFQGVLITIALSAVTVFFGSILGSLLSLLKMARNKVLSTIATAYIEVVRGTPLLLQLFFFYFALPQIPGFNSDQSKIFAITMALGLNSAAYVAEIVRGGIQAVDKGQNEAARSLGLNGKQSMLKVVLPQAVRNILPALGNEFIMVIKESSLASTFFVGELMTQFKTVSGITYVYVPTLIIIGIFYFVLTFILSKVVAAVERRMKAGV